MFENDPLHALMEELDDNAVADTFTQQQQQQQQPVLIQPTTETATQTTRTRSTSRSSRTVEATASNKDWINPQPTNAPFISWTNTPFRYTVQNLTNRGNACLQLQLSNNGQCTNNCAIFLDVDREEDKQIYFTLRKLLLQLENLWVERESGLPKTKSGECLIKTIVPLKTWSHGDEKPASSTTSKTVGNDYVTYCKEPEQNLETAHHDSKKRKGKR